VTSKTLTSDVYVSATDPDARAGERRRVARLFWRQVHRRRAQVTDVDPTGYLAAER